MRYAYWSALQERLAAEKDFKAALQGIDLKKGKHDSYSKDEAKAYIEDPLRDFPDDVDYTRFDDKFLGFKRAEYSAFMKKYQRQPTFEETALLWSPKRINAFQGDDVVAKRASVRGELWAVYQEMEKKKKVTLEELHAVLTADFQLQKLLPSVSELAEYNKDKAQGELYSLTGIVIEIPKEHTEKMFKENTFPAELRHYVR